MCSYVRVDTQGTVPDSNNSCFMSTPLNNEQYWHCLTNVLASSLQTNNATKGFKIRHQTPPLVCLPSVYLTSSHMTKSPYLHTASDQITCGNHLGMRLGCMFYIFHTYITTTNSSKTFFIAGCRRVTSTPYYSCSWALTHAWSPDTTVNY